MSLSVTLCTGNNSYWLFVSMQLSGLPEAGASLKTSQKAQPAAAAADADADLQARLAIYFLISFTII